MCVVGETMDISKTTCLKSQQQFCSSQNKPFDTNVYINIGGQKEKQGVLTVVPTPIGNLKDLSIRQYEALLKADIIACEDTRVTGNMLNLIRQKRISDSFKEAFDVDFQQQEYEANQQQAGIDEEGEDNVLQLIEEFDKTDLVIANQQDDFKKWPSREERLMSKIIEIRKKARKLLMEQETLNIYQDHQEEEFDNSYYGLEDEFIKYLRQKIAQQKRTKGRGVLISYHKYNEELRMERLVKIMNYGLNVALVSDAGTPTISDPGCLLVNRCIKENINIDCLPGSSAVLVALSACGFPSDRFIFEGYLSKSQSEKETKLERIKNLQVTSIIFENLNRLPKTLLSIEKYFGSNQMIFIGFEFTKLYEKKYRGPVRELYEQLTDPEQTKYSQLKGEITMVIPPHTPEFNIDLYQEKDEEIKQKQSIFKEWNKDAYGSLYEQEKVKEAIGLNDDYDAKSFAQKLQNKDQSQKDQNENRVFQVDAVQLGQYLNDNLDVNNKELSEILSDILKISKTRSYNLVKRVRKQNVENKIWNDLFKNSDKLKNK